MIDTVISGMFVCEPFVNILQENIHMLSASLCTTIPIVDGGYTTNLIYIRNSQSNGVELSIVVNSIPICHCSIHQSREEGYPIDDPVIRFLDPGQGQSSVEPVHH